MALLDWLQIQEPATATPATPATVSPLNPVDLYAWFAERAAIREFEGGLSRPEAEAAALADVLGIVESVGGHAHRELER